MKSHSKQTSSGAGQALAGLGCSQAATAYPSEQPT
jgi:hypothetical protein